MQGGYLGFHIEKSEKGFSIEQAKFYAIEILLAIHCLHDNNILYGDLKSGNILLDRNGHIKICDFGSSIILKKKEELVNTRGGTYGYSAPEVLDGLDYGMYADWYSFGCVLYEMLFKSVPYVNNDGKLIIQNYDEYASKEDYQVAIDLLKKLLNENIEKRLREYKDIINHKFFEGIKFEDYAQKKIHPPLKLSFKDDLDLTYFGIVENKLEEGLKEVKEEENFVDMKGKKDISKQFPNFAYSSNSI